MATRSVISGDEVHPESADDGAYRALAEALRQTDQPKAVFEALSALYQARVGFEMLTIIRYDRARGVGRRVYSSNPDTHPIGGDKAIPDTEWTELVLNQHGIFVANRAEDFRDHYSDWRLLEEMGLRSGVNFPVVIRGRTVGSFNLTAGEGFYTPERVAAGEALAGQAALSLLLLDHLQVVQPPR